MDISLEPPDDSSTNGNKPEQHNEEHFDAPPPKQSHDPTTSKNPKPSTPLQLVPVKPNKPNAGHPSCRKHMNYHRNERGPTPGCCLYSPPLTRLARHLHHVFFELRDRRD